MMKLYITIATVLLGWLMLVNISAPWQFSNDDNGAWYTAIARTHIHAGLAVTRGQDFFTRQDSGEQVPYLHHPPLPGLILAGVFRMMGSDTPLIARSTFALLHLIAFIGMAILAGRIWDPATDRLPFLFALTVIVVVPMSNFYGKMPNHETPGLLFFVLGVLAWGGFDRSKRTRHTGLALLSWALASFASWHAALCIVAWLLIGLAGPDRRRAAIGISVVLSFITLVILHIRWANRWMPIESQGDAVRHWGLLSGELGIADTFQLWSRALNSGMDRFAYLPLLLAMGWAASSIRNRCASRCRRATCAHTREIAALGAGTLIYSFLFPRAVSNHAYQLFYLIPFVAIASADMLARLCPRDADSNSRRRGQWGYVFLVLTCVVGILLSHKRHSKVSPTAVKAANDIQAQYL